MKMTDTQLIPVLMLSHDSSLWEHWRHIDEARWLPARGTTVADLGRWIKSRRSFIILDAALPRLPEWDDPSWQTYTGQAQIIVASSRPDDNEAAQALGAGCSGYLHAYSPPETFNRALDAIQSGAIWMGRSLVTKMLKEVSRRLPEANDWATGLTAREKEVAQRAAMGSSNQEIADSLNISERTVRAHLSAVFDKLGVNDRLLLALRVHGVK